jgi:hypothetical protein
MTYIHEAHGQAWEITYGEGCDDCWGLGAVFAHTPSCGSDLCVGNGDEHSCAGSWLPCPSCGLMEKVR